MARRLLTFAALLALAAGCGDSTPLTLPEQALRQVRGGHYEDAIATCNEALRQNANDAAAYHYRGQAYHFRNQPGDLDRAVADFSEAIRLAPLDAEGYYGRSLVYRDQGNQEKSAEDQAKARELDVKLKESYAEMSESAPSGTEPTENAEALDAKRRAEEIKNKAVARDTAETAKDDPLSEPLRPASPGGPLDRSRPFAGSYRSEPEKPSQTQAQINELLKAPQYKMPRTSNQTADADDDESAPPSPRRKATGPTRAGARRPSTAALNDFPASTFELPPVQSPFIPQSPYGGGQSSLPPSYQRPVQSPFRQSGPRTTGFFTEGPQSPFVPRDSQSGAVQPATVHPPGAYQSDFNP